LATVPGQRRSQLSADPLGSAQEMEEPDLVTRRILSYHSLSAEVEQVAFRLGRSLEPSDLPPTSLGVRLIGRVLNSTHSSLPGMRCEVSFDLVDDPNALLRDEFKNAIVGSVTYVPPSSHEPRACLSAHVRSDELVLRELAPLCRLSLYAALEPFHVSLGFTQVRPTWLPSEDTLTFPLAHAEVFGRGQVVRAKKGAA